MQLRTYSSSRLEIVLPLASAYALNAACSSDLILQETTRLVELENVNSEKDAALYLNSFQEWAHPLTLESVTAELTEEQKLIAAKMLKAYFAA